MRRTDPLLQVLIVVVLVLMGLLIPDNPSYFIGTVAALFLAGLGMLWVGRRDDADRQVLVRIFLVAFVLRLVVGSIIYLQRLEPFFGPDAYTYDGFGWGLVGWWETGVIFPDWLRTQVGAGFEFLVALIYWFIGRERFTVQVICCFCGAMTAVMVFKIAKVIFWDDVARRAGWLVALFPSTVIWTSQMLKDPVIIVCVAGVTYCVLKLYNRWEWKYALPFLLVLFYLFFLRAYVFYILAAAALGTYLIGDRRGPLFGLVVQIFFVLAFGFIFSYVRHGGMAVRLDNPEALLTQISSLRRGATLGAGSAFAESVDVSTPGKALAFLPVGLAYLLLGPFPWMVRNFRQASTIPEVLLWWAILPFVVRGITYSIRRRLRQTSTIFVFTTCLTIFYALFEGNLGTAYRQRAQMLIFFLMFAAVGWSLRVLKKSGAPAPELGPALVA